MTARTTWPKWMQPGEPEPSPDDLIQRDELMRRLKARGIEMSDRTVQRWEAAGIIPGPIRRWHDGATRVLYAPWVEDLVVFAHEAKKHVDCPYCGGTGKVSFQARPNGDAVHG